MTKVEDENTQRSDLIERSFHHLSVPRKERGRIARNLLWMSEIVHVFPFFSYDMLQLSLESVLRTLLNLPVDIL